MRSENYCTRKRALLPRKTSPVERLAEELGVSRQRVNALLLAGRVPGAFKRSDGRWDLSGVWRVTEGTRGPQARFRRPQVVSGFCDPFLAPVVATAVSALLWAASSWGVL